MTDLVDIKARLGANAEALALDLFGRPTSRSGQRWNWGRQGSTTMNVKGRWAGRFKSWETDENGSAIDAIMFALGLDFTAAVEWAERWLGDDPNLKIEPVRKPEVFDVDQEEVQRRDKAVQDWTASEPIDGTPGEMYLKSRGLRGPWPSTVRYDVWSRAVIVVSTAPDGTHTAVQRVYIKDDGSPRLDENGRKLKRSHGPRYKGAVRLDGDQRALCLAEGPETGLSIHQATGIETWVGLGQVTSISLEPVPTDRTIIVCRDDDGRRAPSLKNIKAKVKDWRREGRTVLEIFPSKISRGRKGDFNDTLQEAGEDAIRELVEEALTPPADIEQGFPLTWARKSLADEMRKAVDDLWSGGTDKAMKVSLGVGKTHQAIIEAVRWVRADRGNVVIAVPTHALGGEILSRIRAEAGAGIDIAVWRGREADDPTADGEQMCRDIDAVKDVQLAGGDPQKLVCINGDKKCAFAEVCGYQKQRLQKGQIWIVAHQALFTQKPETIPVPSLVIIDESFHNAGLRGTTGHPMMVTPYQLDQPPVSKYGVGPTADLHSTLKPSRDKLKALIDGQALGPLSRTALIDSGLTAEECIAASKAEWERMVALEVYPGMSATDRKKVVRTAQNNAEIPRMAKMWKLLAEVLEDDHVDRSGRLWINEGQKEGSRYNGIQLIYHDQIREGWKAPTLHIDATMELDLVRPYLPNVELVADIKAAAPHQNITQYVNKSFSKQWMADERNVDGLWWWCLSRARIAGGKWLVVVQKDAEELIRQRHAIPDFIELAHHNDVAGRDEWKDVRGLIVAGRTQPRVDGVERIAGALTGRHHAIPTADDGYYGQRMEAFHSTSGDTVSIPVDTAGNSIAESVRRSICESQVEQIIGRARGVNRTEADPVEIHVLTNVQLESEVTELREWEKLNLIDRKFAESGVHLTSIGDLATIHSVKANTLKVAKQRMGTKRYIESLYGSVPNLQMATYQRKGAGNSKQEAYYSVAHVPDIEHWLTERLGTLASFEQRNHNPRVGGSEQWTENPLPDPIVPNDVRSPDRRIRNPMLSGAQIRTLADPTGFEDQPASCRQNENLAHQTDFKSVVYTNSATPDIHGVNVGVPKLNLRPSGYEPDELSKVVTPTGFEPQLTVLEDGKVVPRGGITPPEEPVDSGILPDNVITQLRALKRDSGWTQEEMAKLIGISRPQLANACQQRFGLGRESMARLYHLLAHPPPVRQASLFPT